MKLDQQYPVVITQNVVWGDMDAFGHVNNTVYFRYFEDARIAYFDRIGMHETKRDSGIGPIMATSSCNFRLPLDYPDRIQVATRAHILSPRKFNMEFVVYSERHDAIAADGDGLMVYFDYANRKSCQIPATIVKAIEELEAPFAGCG